jgi:hypothetical protein
MEPFRFLWIAAMLAVGAPDEVKLVGVGVHPSPFGFGPMTIVCAFGAGHARHAGTPASPGAPGRRFQVRIEDNVSSHVWTSAWMPVPEVGGGAPVVATIDAWYLPDTALVSRVTEILVTGVLDDGAGRITMRRANFFRWTDELFHRTPDYAARTRSDWAPEPPPAIAEAAPEPQWVASPVPEAPWVEEKPVEWTTWGCVKRRYGGPATRLPDGRTAARTRP